MATYCLLHFACYTFCVCLLRWFSLQLHLLCLHISVSLILLTQKGKQNIWLSSSSLSIHNQLRPSVLCHQYPCPNNFFSGIFQWWHHRRQKPCFSQNRSFLTKYLSYCYPCHFSAWNLSWRWQALQSKTLSWWLFLNAIH